MEKPMDLRAPRQCSECGETLHPDEFRYQKRRRDGRHLICLDCEAHDKTLEQVVSENRQVAIAKRLAVSMNKRSPEERKRDEQRASQLDQISRDKVSAILSNRIERDYDPQEIEVLFEHLGYAVDIVFDVLFAIRHAMTNTPGNEAKGKNEKLNLFGSELSEAFAKIKNIN